MFIERKEAQVDLKLLTKPECHLCAAARQTMDEVTSEYNIGWQEISTTDHPQLAEQFAEEIPVLFVDGKQRDFWVIDPARMRVMIEAGLAS
ncbi:glutaredoxin family protein [Enteractinococcus coprophilus]|uniref:Glutaredoxin n=1 Tax=Enteractinococcus coprophilus TaxID=1027633 RepID=A0A543AM05_9MICC|nr:glutaredoxin family protein [Enteractinococcus coprophilus]TQL73633.1 glutaredoxin [Enteractinococcus coprophilus]